MHPLVGYGLGALAGALFHFFWTGGIKERYERIAFAVGLGLLVLGGVALAWTGWPPIPGFGKRAWATMGAGLAVLIAGCNIGVMAQVPSGGFSSARTSSMMGVVGAVVLLAVCLPHLRPG